MNMFLKEKTYKKFIYLILTVFITAIGFVIFNVQPTAGNIFSYSFSSFIISLFIGSATIHLFSTKHINNITYLQRLIILPLFLGLLTVSIVAGKSIQIANELEASKKLALIEKNEVKTKLEKTEKELRTAENENRNLKNRNNKSEKDFWSEIPKIPKEKPKPKSQGRYRIGAICCDGTRSYATGRGACSWHGGVCEWLYSE